MGWGWKGGVLFFIRCLYLWSFLSMNIALGTYFIFMAMFTFFLARCVHPLLLQMSNFFYCSHAIWCIFLFVFPLLFATLLAWVIFSLLLFAKLTPCPFLFDSSYKCVWFSSMPNIWNEYKSAQHSICIQSVAHYTIVSNTCLEWCKCYIKYFVIQSHYMLCRNYKKSIFKYATYTEIGWLSKHSIYKYIFSSFQTIQYYFCTSTRHWHWERIP